MKWASPSSPSAYTPTKYDFCTGGQFFWTQNLKEIRPVGDGLEHAGFSCMSISCLSIGAFFEDYSSSCRAFPYQLTAEAYACGQLWLFVHVL